MSILLISSGLTVGSFIMMMMWGTFRAMWRLWNLHRPIVSVVYLFIGVAFYQPLRLFLDISLKSIWAIMFLIQGGYQLVTVDPVNIVSNAYDEGRSYIGDALMSVFAGMAMPPPEVMRTSSWRDHLSGYSAKDILESLFPVAQWAYIMYVIFVIVFPVFVALWCSCWIYKRCRTRTTQAFYGMSFEAMFAGSRLIPATLPPFQCEVWVNSPDGLFSRSGMAFRAGDWIVTANHVISGEGKVLLKTNKATVELTVDDFSHLDCDLVAIRFNPSLFQKLELKAGKFGKTQVIEGVANFVCVNGFGQKSIGNIKPHKQFGMVIYEGSTVEGFSGAPYYTHNQIFGMHLGYATANVGFDGNYICAMLRSLEESGKYLLRLAELYNEDFSEAEYKRNMIRDGKMMVRLNNSYYSIDEDSEVARIIKKNGYDMTSGLEWRDDEEDMDEEEIRRFKKIANKARGKGRKGKRTYFEESLDGEISAERTSVLNISEPGNSQTMSAVGKAEDPLKDIRSIFKQLLEESFPKHIEKPLEEDLETDDQIMEKLKDTLLAAFLQDKTAKLPSMVKLIEPESVKLKTSPTLAAIEFEDDTGISGNAQAPRTPGQSSKPAIVLVNSNKGSPAIAQPPSLLKSHQMPSTSTSTQVTPNLDMELPQSMPVQQSARLPTILEKEEINNDKVSKAVRRKQNVRAALLAALKAMPRGERERLWTQTPGDILTTISDKL